MGMTVQRQQNNKTAIGILDLQGGVHEHLDHLQRLGLDGRRVKKQADFNNLCGLIIPGGESSCIARLLNIFDLRTSLLKAHAEGMKIWGTCAGAILLAQKVVGETACLGLLDIEIERNSFGSQLDSFQSEALIPAVTTDVLPLTFIRAPKILSIGKGVRVLLKIGDYIAAAESENILVTVFHPELTGSLAFHRYFARKCGIMPAGVQQESTAEPWDHASWMKFARIV